MNESQKYEEARQYHHHMPTEIILNSPQELLIQLRDAYIWHPLLRCIVRGRQYPKYEKQLIAVSMTLEKIGCMHFPLKNGEREKVSRKTYQRRIWDDWIESVEEARDRLKEAGELWTGTAAQDLLDCYQAIRDACLPRLTDTEETWFWHEYYHLIDSLINGKEEKKMAFDTQLDEELDELKGRWEYEFWENVNDYAFAEAELDEAEFASLILATAKALTAALPKKKEEPLHCWEGAMGLFGCLKAYSVYPIVVEDDSTLSFEVSQIIAKRLVERFESAHENWDILTNFAIPMDDLPDTYEKNPVGMAFIPYDLTTGDMEPIKAAIRDGGVYNE